MISNLKQLHSHYLDTWKSQGWHVQHMENEVSLHEMFKNGRPKKGATASIRHEPVGFMLIGDTSTGKTSLVETGPRERPWVVRSKGSHTRTFGLLNQAAQYFAEQASRLAPAPDA